MNLPEKNEIDLRPYQQEAVSKIVNAAHENKNRATIQMIPGSGKTIVLLHAVEKILNFNDGKILIVISRKIELEQLNATFKLLKLSRKLPWTPNPI